MKFYPEGVLLCANYILPNFKHFFRIPKSSIYNFHIKKINFKTDTITIIHRERERERDRKRERERERERESMTEK